MPNQFWVHKNHAVVIDALDILRKQGITTLVLATGSQIDHRNPNYFRQLMDRVRYSGLENSFRVLGLVTLSELKSLMQNTISMINPSNFEGWSSSVEESKSLGIPIILSDIPVHLEQAPRLGRYFKAGSAEALAEVMLAAIKEYDPARLIKFREMAAIELPERVVQFGKAYEEIILN